jgi:hypothetical protein
LDRDYQDKEELTSVDFEIMSLTFLGNQIMTFEGMLRMSARALPHQQSLKS